MRLDKFLGITGCCSRTDAKRAVRAGRVEVNGVAIKVSDANIDPENDVVIFCGKEVVYRKYTYIMLNKPAGYVSATDDTREKTVLDLLPNDMKKDKLFPCGRLDKDTVGLIMLTNDGDLAHKLLSPKKHAEKIYAFELDKPHDKTRRIEDGIMMDGKLTKPAVIEMETPTKGRITLTEGKYHQIKRMFEYAGSTVTYLERLSFGGVLLDTALERGQWRYLTEAEEKTLRENDV